MSDQLILQLITTISLFCSEQTNIYHVSQAECFKTIWTCGHKTNQTSVIVTETHNCITDYIKKSY